MVSCTHQSTFCRQCRSVSPELCNVPGVDPKHLPWRTGGGPVLFRKHLRWKRVDGGYVQKVDPDIGGKIERHIIKQFRLKYPTSNIWTHGLYLAEQEGVDAEGDPIFNLKITLMIDFDQRIMLDAKMMNLLFGLDPERGEGWEIISLIDEANQLGHCPNYHRLLHIKRMVKHRSSGRGQRSVAQSHYPQAQRPPHLQLEPLYPNARQHSSHAPGYRY